MSTTWSPLDTHDVVNKLKGTGFMYEILEHLNSVLQQINVIRRYIFRQYNELINKIEKFKKALLNYVFDFMVYL